MSAAAFQGEGERLPALFVGHGSPMNAIEDNPYSRAWREQSASLPRPRAILCVSAHWETRGTRVTAVERPKTIHDFYGFPQALYRRQYPAPGSPELAELLRRTAPGAHIEADRSWGLDHGTWSVLCHLFPQADVPVVQLSLDRSLPPAAHYELGRALGPLRTRGVLIVGSGNVVHNLGRARFEGPAYDWALEFDEAVRDRVEAGDHAALIDYSSLTAGASVAVPTNEHYLPLLYLLGVQDAGEPARFFCESIDLGSVSMRSLRLG